MVRGGALTLESTSPGKTSAGGAVSGGARRPAVVVSGLTKRFGDHVVLDNLTFQVAAEEFVSILGHSGCGKTTLLNCLAGLDEYEGSVAFGGAGGLHGDVNCAMVFQDFALFPWLSVADNLGFGLKFAARRVSGGEHRRRVAELLSLMGLETAERLYPHQLSGGMRQRVAVARALAVDPDVLLMDEPFASLDALTRHRLGNETEAIWQATGKVIILVTHDASEAVRLSDRILILHDGRIRHVQEIRDPRPRSLAHPHIGEKVEAIEELLAALQRTAASAAEGLPLGVPHRVRPTAPGDGGPALERGARTDR